MRFSFSKSLAALIVIASPLHSSAFAQSISANQDHTCAVSEAGEAYCWGRMAWLANKDGTVEVPFDAATIPHLSHAPNKRFFSIATGLTNDCALLRDGQVFCSGRESSEMGRDTSRKCGSTCGLPDTIDTPERFRSVVSGSAHWCALARDGRAFCWGWNTDGQIGIGTRSNVVSRPTPVIGDHRFVSLTAGMRHTCGLTVGGEALCWGGNTSLQLGSNGARRGCRPNDVCTATPSPIDESRRFVVLKAYQDKTCGITATGALYCWGANYSRIEGDKPLALTHIGATFAFADVSPGGTWFSCAIAVGGRAYCWKESGMAPVGQDLVNWGCADGPTCIDETPIGDDLRFRSIASGLMHACGITTDGAVYCWGLKNPQKVADRGAQCMGPKPDPANECAAAPVRIGGTLNLNDAATKRAKKATPRDVKTETVRK